MAMATKAGKPHRDIGHLRAWVQREIEIRRSKGDRKFGAQTLVRTINKVNLGKKGISQIDQSNGNAWKYGAFPAWLRPATQEAIASYMIDQHGAIEQWLYRNMPHDLQKKYKAHLSQRRDPQIETLEDDVFAMAIDAIEQATIEDKPAIAKILKTIAAWMEREDVALEAAYEEISVPVPTTPDEFRETIGRYAAEISEELEGVISVKRLEEISKGIGPSVSLDEVAGILDFWGTRDRGLMMAIFSDGLDRLTRN